MTTVCVLCVMSIKRQLNKINKTLILQQNALTPLIQFFNNNFFSILFSNYKVGRLVRWFSVGFVVDGMLLSSSIFIYRYDTTVYSCLYLYIICFLVWPLDLFILRGQDASLRVRLYISFIPIDFRTIGHWKTHSFHWTSSSSIISIWIPPIWLDGLLHHHHHHHFISIRICITFSS